MTFLGFAMSDADLTSVQAIAAHYESPTHALPMTGQHITHSRPQKPHTSLSAG